MYGGACVGEPPLNSKSRDLKTIAAFSAFILQPFAFLLCPFTFQKNKSSSV
jgi:hypothetical protein